MAVNTSESLLVGKVPIGIGVYGLTATVTAGTKLRVRIGILRKQEKK